jgi:hypothetical protein
MVDFFHLLAFNLLCFLIFTGGTVLCLRSPERRPFFLFPVSSAPPILITPPMSSLLPSSSTCTLSGLLSASAVLQPSFFSVLLP